MEDKDQTVLLHDWLFTLGGYSQWKNELKARGTLLIALPDKHQLKFNIHKDAKNLIEAIEKRFGGNKETKKNLGANGPTSMGFDMSKVECFNCHRKGHFARECRSSKDTRRNVQVETQMRSVTVKTSTSKHWFHSVMGWEAITGDFRQKKNQPTMHSWLSPPKVLLVLIMRDNALVVLRQKFKKAKQERDELKLKLEKFQTSSKNLSQLLASQTNDKTRLGYDNHVFTSSMFDCDEMFSFESDVTMPASPIYYRPSAPIIEDWVSDSEESEADPSQNDSSFVQPTEQVKTPRPSVKPVAHSILTANLMTTNPKPKTHGNSKNRKACFVLLTKSKLVPFTAARTVTTAIPQSHMTRPRPAKTIVTKPHSPPRRNINRIPSPKPSNFPPKVTTVKAPMVNAVKGIKGNCGNLHHALKDKEVIDSGCLRHMIGNMSYLSDFKEINGGYVAFGRNPKGGKITGKGKIRTGKLDFDDVYFVEELKFNLFSVSQMVLVTKPHNKTPYELLLVRTPSIGFMIPFGCLVTILNTLDPLENKPNVAGSGATWLFDIDTLTKSANYQPVIAGNQSNPSAGVQEQFDARKEGEENEPEFEVEKHESEVYIFPSSNAKTKKHDDKTKSERLKARVHTPVPTVGQISTNSTNTFNVVGPSNTAVSLTLGESSYVDPS
nr:ribonuclease H-like domain-containing protein [Tanacetum cinerariifolium]